jgi:hypothetical protein
LHTTDDRPLLLLRRAHDLTKAGERGAPTRRLVSALRSAVSSLTNDTREGVFDPGGCDVCPLDPVSSRLSPAGRGAAPARVVRGASAARLAWGLGVAYRTRARHSSTRRTPESLDATRWTLRAYGLNRSSGWGAGPRAARAPRSARLAWRAPVRARRAEIVPCVRGCPALGSCARCR